MAHGTRAFASRHPGVPMTTPRPELKYHADAFRVLGVEPTADTDALVLIRACEAACRVRLPEAVREWYSLAGVERLLTHYQEECGPTDLDRVLNEWAAIHPRHPDDDERDDPRILLYHSYTGHSEWESHLVVTGDDDPPVDAGEGYHRVLFSQFTLEMAWWRMTFNDQSSRAYGWDEKEPAVFGPPHLDFMNEHFAEVQRGRRAWFSRVPPGAAEADHRTFRFVRGGWLVQIDAGGDPATGFRPAVYELTAATKDQLRGLDEFLLSCRERGVT